MYGSLKGSFSGPFKGSFQGSCMGLRKVLSDNPEPRVQKFGVSGPVFQANDGFGVLGL